MTRKPRRIDPRHDGGTSLLLVLILVTVVSVLVAALLTSVDTGARTTVALRDVAVENSAADGATQAAINNIRNNTFAATDNKCFADGAGQATERLSLPDFGGEGVSATVTCAAEAPGPPIGCTTPSTCNRPAGAILTTGRNTSEDGVRVEQPSTMTTQVRGGVMSNSNIRVNGGTLATDRALYARTGCTGVVSSDPAPQCTLGPSATNPLGYGPDNDPGYTHSATVPPWRPLPPCTTPNSVVVFEPGYYDDAVALSAMMSGTSPCRGSTWWFKPGMHYFDFRNDRVPSENFNNALPPGPNIWNVKDGNIVAGTPSTGATPPVNPTMPGSCVSPLKSETAVGAQFVFGGSSRFQLDGGKAEICGTYNANSPPVAMYGQPTGNESAKLVLGMSGSTGISSEFLGLVPGLFGSISSLFGDPTAKMAVDGVGNTVGSITVGGLFAPAPIPPGSVLKSAQFKVAHKYTKSLLALGQPKEELGLRIIPNQKGAGFSVPVPGYNPLGFLLNPLGLQEDTVDVTGLLSDTVRVEGLIDGGMTYTAKVDKPGHEEFGGVTFTYAYYPPMFRKPAGCLVGRPYTGGGATAAQCALITQTANPANELYIQGTTYAPRGAVDVTTISNKAPVFNSGVIGQSVWLRHGAGAETNSPAPVAVVPADGGSEEVMSVYLSTYVCRDSGECPTTGQPARRAKVTFKDADPAAPVAGDRGVRVVGWSTPTEVRTLN